MSRIAEALEPSLFDRVTVSVTVRPDDVPYEICVMFETLALRVAAKGFTKYSARAIFHRLRWEEHIEKGNRDFKINNNDSAKLARWFLTLHPELPGFFELRESGED